jgi:hypothetical protein
MNRLASVRLDQLIVTSDAISEVGPGCLSVRGPRGRATAPGSESTVVCIQFRYLGESDIVIPSNCGQDLHQIGAMIRHTNQCNLVYLTWRILPALEVLLQVKRNPGADQKCPGGYHVVDRRPQAPFAIGEMHEVLVEVAPSSDGSAIASVWADWQPAMQSTIGADLLVGIDGPPGFRSDNGKYDFRYFVEAHP